jgi:hypothetical protein
LSRYAALAEDALSPLPVLVRPSSKPGLVNVILPFDGGTIEMALEEDERVTFDDED